LRAATKGSGLWSMYAVFKGAFLPVRDPSQRFTLCFISSQPDAMLTRFLRHIPPERQSTWALPRLRHAPVWHDGVTRKLKPSAPIADLRRSLSLVPGLANGQRVPHGLRNGLLSDAPVGALRRPGKGGGLFPEHCRAHIRFESPLRGGVSQDVETRRLGRSRHEPEAPPKDPRKKTRRGRRLACTIDLFRHGLGLYGNRLAAHMETL
jgi:hypothetical protein